MKKLITILLLVACVCMLVVPAMAVSDSRQPKAGPAPTIKVPSSMEVYQDEALELYCDATDPNGGKLSYLWYETSTGKLQDIIAINRGAENRDTLRCDTSTTGTRYYVCAVDTSSGGTAYSSVIAVTVLEKTHIQVKFTQDSRSYIGYTMAVDIEAMIDEDARIWNAFLEGDVKYQWYKDGTPISGATTASLKMAEKYEGCRIHVTVTCFDLVIRSEAFEVTKETPPFAIEDNAVPDGKTGEAYSFQLRANDPDAHFQIYYNPGRPNEFEETGLHLSSDGKITGTPSKAGEYTFTVHASCAAGEDYRILTLTVTEGNEISLEVLEAPDKVVYYSGETLDLTGLKVRVYENGTHFDSLNGDKLTITTKPLVTVGEQKIKVTYKGEGFDIFIVTVKENKAAVELLEAPTKVEYFAGETLDLTGLKVRVYNPDGTYFDSLNGDKLTISTKPLVTLGEQKIKITYGEYFDWFIVTVKEAPVTDPDEPKPTEPTNPEESKPTEPAVPDESKPTNPTNAPEDTKVPTKPAQKQSKPAENGTPLVVVVIIAVACVALGAGVTFFLVTKKKR